jgi:hypothetical protein
MLRKLTLKTVAVVSHLLVIGVFSLFAQSIYGLTEDFYVAYLLGDGFGIGPTHLLHYNYGMHPILGKLLSVFFSITNEFNWYSLLLMSVHGLSGSLIFYCILRKSTHWFYIAGYWVLFFVFEGDTLLHVNFNNTALVLYVAAVVWLLAHTCRGQLNAKQGTIAALIFIAASLFRMHVGLIIVGLSVPFFLIIYNKTLLRSIMGMLFLTGILVFSLHYWQEYYYEQSIYQWRQEESRRQQVYQLYNNKSLSQITDTASNWYLPYQMARNALLVDSGLLDGAQLVYMLQEVKHMNNRGIWQRWKNWQTAGTGKNWFLVNNKIFLLTGLFSMLVLPLTRGQKIAGWFSILLLLGGCFYLILYARLMDYVVISGIYTIVLLLLITSDPTLVPGRLNNQVVMGFMFLIGVWAILHIARSSQRNGIRITQFRNSYAKIAAAPDKLFVITSYEFPLQSYSIWDVPAQYPLWNFISNEHFLLNIQSPSLKRNNVSNFGEILYRKNVLFWGNETAILKKYFERLTGKKVTVSPPIQDFPPGAEVRTINIETQ